MTELNQVTKMLATYRLAIKQYVFESYIDGSEHRVIEAIESEINNILDERDSLLTNVFEELYEKIKTIEETFEKGFLSKEEHRQIHSKGQCLPDNNR